MLARPRYPFDPFAASLNFFEKSLDLSWMSRRRRKVPHQLVEPNLERGHALIDGSFNVKLDLLETINKDPSCLGD
jgi:hypothetical protein